MKIILPILAILCSLSCAHAIEPQNPLTVRNDFGVHKPQENLEIEVYATTKGGLNYSVTIKDGDNTRSFGSNIHDGNSISFYLDTEKKRLWRRSSAHIGFFDYYKRHNKSETFPLSMAQKLKAPAAALDSSKCFTLSPFLGKLSITDSVSIDIYADTRGEVWRSVYINGKHRDGALLECKEPGSTCIFYWDHEAGTLWSITKKEVSRATYKDASMSHSYFKYGDDEVRNAPSAVKTIMEKMQKGEK